jgi:hypothetical protein
MLKGRDAKLSFSHGLRRVPKQFISEGDVINKRYAHDQRANKVHVPRQLTPPRISRIFFAKAKIQGRQG